ncbi:RDD family protein [Brachybacterium squillarum]|uniref:RDD family protein n=1 Tax=Brachybacterium squillarum TaxID=661979 RepID=UPI0022235EA9|nr:RDD family protein [Brachybacterium squillarum]MCW1805685.1 RDD family protein [Brachybacterium squillarum]
MIERKDLGSWMDGAPSEAGHVPGSTWGLPADGPGAVAPAGRRFATLLVDWALASVVSALVFDDESVATLALFATMNVLLITVFGATPGQFLLRLRVTPVSGRSPMVLRALIRTLLLLLVLPAVIWNRDRQPLHDAVAGTAVVRA